MKKDSCKITFTGDIGFDRYMDGKWRDNNLLSKTILKFCRNSDHVIANVEGAVVPSEKINIKNTDDYCHFINSDAICVLSKINADIWNLANNHIMDVGEYGLISTLKLARQNNSLTIGAGRNIAEASKPVILNDAGGIGIISVGYAPDCLPATDENAGVFSMSDHALIKKKIEEVKRICRWCIIVAHGGEEFTNLPSPYTRDRYIKFMEFGADIIVCHHPHVVMNYEMFDKKAIFYSLGNFIFDTDYQRAQYNTERGVILKLIFNENEFCFECLGLKTNREKGNISDYAVPEIFTDIPEEEYEKLLPLSAKAFVWAEKKRKKFLHPEAFNNFSEAEWEKYLLSEKREEYIKGETMDFSVILPIAKKEQKKGWETSSLSGVKEYILGQISKEI